MSKQNIFTLIRQLDAPDWRFQLTQYCMDYHNGQWSRLYRLLSRLSPRHNWTSKLSQELREESFYKLLEENKVQ